MASSNQSTFCRRVNFWSYLIFELVAIDEYATAMLPRHGNMFGDVQRYENLYANTMAN